MALKLARDLRSAAERKCPYFLGSFATSFVVDDDGGSKVFLYDGLQRMTTLTVTLYALWRFVNQEHAQHVTTVREIGALLFVDDGLLCSKQEARKGRSIVVRHLHLADEDERNLEQLHESMFSLLESHDRLLEELDREGKAVILRNFNYIVGYFSSLKKKMLVTEVLDYVKYVRSNSVKIIHVRSSPSFIKEIFMVLNTPGMAALEGDLIKARLSQYYDSERPGGEGAEMFIKFWTAFSTRLERNWVSWADECTFDVY
jgi:hypothetical protein